MNSKGSILSVVLCLTFSACMVMAVQETNSLLPVVHQRITPEMSSDCKFIRIPPTLCSGCRMRKFTGDGQFKINKDIYDIDDPFCREGLKQYAKLNPCDTPRVKYISSFDNVNSKWRIAFFMYNICETCCDCVPFYTKTNQYEERKKNKALLDIYRGNCPVHVWYDTCRMWPNVTWVGTPNSDFSKYVKNPKKPVCEDLRPWWFDSGHADSWITKSKVPLPSEVITTFMWRFIWLLQCSNKQVWTECVNLENAQGRLGF